MTNPPSLWLCVLLLAPGSSSAFHTDHVRISKKVFRAQRDSRRSMPSPFQKTALRVAMPFEDDTLPSSIDPMIPRISQPPHAQQKLAPEDAWIANLDYEAFRKEVATLGKELRSDSGDADVDHLNKLIGWRNFVAALGISTVWMAPNPITVVALSTWTYASWAMIAHHTCHGGYNRVDAGTRFKSRRFALGLVNRVVDWLDWMQPEAWNVEHNRLHHYNLNEVKDPDLVQRNLDFIRDNDRLPMFARYAAVLSFLPIWKWFYYSPNTYKELRINELLKASGGTEKGVLPENFDRESAATVAAVLDPFSAQGRALREVVPPHKLFLEVLGPMLVGRYLFVPALLLGTMGPVVAAHAFWNLLASELLTNVHAFVTIVTNHGACVDACVTLDSTPEISKKQRMSHTIFGYPSFSNFSGRGFVHLRRCRKTQHGKLLRSSNRWQHKLSHRDRSRRLCSRISQLPSELSWSAAT